jgi:hypothetical protein
MSSRIEADLLDMTGDEQGLARAIAEADFTRASAVLPALEACVTQAAHAWSLSRAALRSERPAARVARFFLRPAPIAVLSLCLALVLIQCVTPGGLPAAGRAAGAAILTFLKVGPHTEVKNLGPNEVHRTAPSPKTWYWPTPLGTVVERIPQGAPAAGWKFDTVEAARALVPAFRFKQPGTLPDGYHLAGVTLSPSKEWLVESYRDDAGHELTLVAHDASRGRGTQFGSDSAGGITRTSVNGAVAGWIGSALSWEENGVSYILGDRSLSLDQARRIAESMK